MTEVLQGCPTEREFNSVRKTLEALTFVTLGGPDVAVLAAKHLRQLRARGVTVRKTIDSVIATRCILDGLELLHCDRDFDPFEKHLGLRCVSCEA
jgi:predicted nucleic acid-binding protein